LVFRPLIVAPPDVVTFNAPPAVVMVSFAPSIVKAPAVNVTELAPVCARLRTLSPRSSIVMLVVAAIEMFVVAAMPSSSDSKMDVGVVSVARTVPVVPDGSPAKLVVERSMSSPSLVPLRMVIVADI